jgi:hypothetical protein
VVSQENAVQLKAQRVQVGWARERKQPLQRAGEGELIDKVKKLLLWWEEHQAYGKELYL